MRLHEIIPNDPLLEDLSRRGFLKGLGAGVGLASFPKISFSANSESDIAIGAKKLAWVAWEMKNRGFSSTQIKAGFINMPLVGKARDIGIEIADAIYNPKYSSLSQSQFQDAMVARFTTRQSAIQKKKETDPNDTQSVSTGYASRIKSRIEPNIMGQNAGPVSVEIRSMPDGTIISRKLVRPSGSAEWDNAVLKGIDKTDVLPRDTDGRVPQTITITF